MAERRTGIPFGAAQVRTTLLTPMSLTALQNARPDTAIVLGSGLGAVAEAFGGKVPGSPDPGLKAWEAVRRPPHLETSALPPS